MPILRYLLAEDDIQRRATAVLLCPTWKQALEEKKQTAVLPLPIKIARKQRQGDLLPLKNALWVCAE